jgi:hypothetical protein
VLLFREHSFHIFIEEVFTLLSEHEYTHEVEGWEGAIQRHPFNVPGAKVFSHTNVLLRSVCVCYEYSLGTVPWRIELCKDDCAAASIEYSIIRPHKV